MKSLKMFYGNVFFLIVLGFFAGAVVAPAKAFASCEMYNDDKMELFVSPESGHWGNFSGKSDLLPSFVNKCKDDGNKYLMLTLGVSRPSKESNIREVFIYDNYKPEKCQLKNSHSMASIRYSSQIEHFSEQFKLLRSCINLKVSDVNGMPLVFKQKQDHCQIQKLDDGSAILSGDMCFLKISSRSQFAILPVIKDECLQPDYFKNSGFDAQDLEANLDVLVAGDDSGNSIDVQQIGSRSILMNVMPSESLAPLSENLGPELPRFISDYSVDVDWGRLSIRPNKNSTQINVGFLASNLSEKICQDGECYRTSNFIQPTFGQVEVFEFNKNKNPTLIEEWWDGGFAAANWQGFISGMGYSTIPDLFVLGKKYRIQVTFQNPLDDYAIFISGLNQMLINLNSTNSGIVGIDTIPAIQTLKQIGALPPFMGAGILKGNDQSVNLNQIIKGLSDIVTSRIWPAYFEQVCDETKNSCLKIGKQKFYRRLVLEFTAGDINVSTGELALNNLTLQKESKIYKSYSKAVTGFPEIICQPGDVN